MGRAVFKLESGATKPGLQPLIPHSLPDSPSSPCSPSLVEEQPKPKALVKDLHTEKLDETVITRFFKTLRDRHESEWQKIGSDFADKSSQFSLQKKKVYGDTLKPKTGSAVEPQLPPEPKPQLELFFGIQDSNNLPLPILDKIHHSTLALINYALQQPAQAALAAALKNLNSRVSRLQLCSNNFTAENFVKVVEALE